MNALPCRPFVKEPMNHVDLVLQALERWFVRQQQRSPERVRQQFAAEIVDEIVLPMLADVGLQTLKSGAVAAAGKNRLRIDMAAGEVLGTPLANRPVALEHQAEGIKTRMTGGANLVL